MRIVNGERMAIESQYDVDEKVITKLLQAPNQNLLGWGEHN